ncbi:hypothetical protein CEXT_48801 [Caerostris extrusa]|uniref:Uncharacterized protein n=1 Tax=Caerostris extrusa TaxID=172846 RepID=A0AAV4SZZ7_CAEEX|nr:hypothetical protein CEXT_48801 [Caerostris extrusa]
MSSRRTRRREGIGFWNWHLILAKGPRGPVDANEWSLLEMNLGREVYELSRFHLIAIASSISKERERESALVSGDHQFLINVYQKAVHRKRLCRLLVFRLSPHSSFASGAIIALSEGIFSCCSRRNWGKGECSGVKYTETSFAL